MDKNKKSSEDFGWDPSWFGCDSFDKELIENIKAYQKESGLKCTGFVDDATYRRIFTEQDLDVKTETRMYLSKEENFLAYGNQEIKIFWDKFVRFDETGGLSHEKQTYYNYKGKNQREIKMFVNHWDACLNSASCARIINKRGLSMHFLIDNDGTIYQMLDMQHAAWQCGDRKVNKVSLGVEISNAFYTKYQDWYIKNGFGERPIIERSYVNNYNVGKHLGFYEIQLNALAALWEAVSYGTDTKLEILSSRKVEKSVLECEFSGFVNHYNIKKNKPDCASLNMEKVLKEAERIRFMHRDG